MQKQTMANEGKCEKLPDKSIKLEDFPAEILLKILNFLEINVGDTTHHKQ